MNKLITIAIILIGLVSCSNNIKKKSTDFTLDYQNLEIVTIDSCEYIYWSGKYLTHKGNCKNHK